MKITEKRLRSIIRSVIKESMMGSPDPKREELKRFFLSINDGMIRVSDVVGEVERICGMGPMSDESYESIMDKISQYCDDNLYDMTIARNMDKYDMYRDEACYFKFPEMEVDNLVGFCLAACSRHSVYREQR